MSDAPWPPALGSEPRLVLLSGPLDEAAVEDAVARLLVLDRASDEPIAVLVNSPGGVLGEAATLLDVLGSLRSPLEVTAVGRAHGTAGVVVAGAPGRRLGGARASLSLRCQGAEALSGTAHELAGLAGALASLRQGLVARLAERTGRPEAWLADQLERGPVIDARAALGAGLLDALTSR